MRRLFFDASALAKRYTPEVGTAVVNRVFESVDPDRMLFLTLGAGEAVAVLVRRRNAGHINAEALAAAKDEVLREVLHSDEFTTIPISDADVEAALPHLETYSLNLTDAALLHIALEHRRGWRVIGDDLVLVASDGRLLRAADAEGLSTFNPETQSGAELDALLAGG